MTETREAIQVEALRCYFNNGQLDGSISNEISRVLGIQYQEDDLPEVGGSIIAGNDATLELRVNESDVNKEVETSISAFEEGDYSSISHLYEFLCEARDTQESYLGKSHPDIFVLNGLVTILDRVMGNEDAPLSGDKRLGLANLFRKIVGSFYAFKEDEIEADDGYLLGLFHVHKQRQPPSGGDIKKNRQNGLPNLVIGATSDYQKEGVDVYLVHSGKQELLYRGEL